MRWWHRSPARLAGQLFVVGCLLVLHSYDNLEVKINFTLYHIRVITEYICHHCLASVESLYHTTEIFGNFDACYIFTINFFKS